MESLSPNACPDTEPEAKKSPEDLPPPLRADSPDSDASTSGVCSMASSDSIDSSDDVACPVIIYEKRNILNVFENIYPFSVFQSTRVPRANMSNYWAGRSIYHRLGPFGRIDELDHKKCTFCDFRTTVPKIL